MLIPCCPRDPLSQTRIQHAAPPMRRRWRWIPPALAIALLLTAPRAGSALPGTEGGFVPVASARERADAYLEFATANPSKGSILNAIAHMERDVRDSTYTAPTGAVEVADWAPIFRKLETLQDTRDFDGLYLTNALLGYEGHPYLTPETWDRVREVLLSFKMWVTDPTPPTPDPDDPVRDWDESIYWTENHQALYHTIELLLGERFPEECFTIVGFPPTGNCSGEFEMTGAEHRDRAHAFLLRWFEERWDIGFVEWHSNIYYQKDATPLLSLVEFAASPEIRTRAAILLDILLLNLATHTHRDVLGVTHGRSEMKDTYFGPRNDTWGIVHLLFGQQDTVGHTSAGEPGATLFSRARQYRMPSVILEAAHAPGPFVDRMRMSVPLDEGAPIGPDPESPPGHPFTDDEPGFTFWWGLGAWTVWQVLPISLGGADRYQLFDTAFFAPFKPLLALLPDGPAGIALGQGLAQSFWQVLALGLLEETNTYTYRGPEYILSTAQSYRPGANSAQVHAWQATFDPFAMVFTTHPMNSLQPPSEWVSSTDGQPGYWTGSASLPRSAQHENVGIYQYEPGYQPGAILPGTFVYQPFTHAYFPQDYFDEVEQAGHWTFGRAGDGYIALYSWRSTFWQTTTPEELALLPDRPGGGPVTRPFDLIADGGADNVWIVECGDAARWGSFDAFRTAILEAPVVVADRNGAPGFDVSYTSPSQGAMTLGWEAPLTVAGQEIAIDDYPRIDNPWVTAQRGDPVWHVQGAETGVVLDWENVERTVFVPEPGAGLGGVAALLLLIGCARRDARRRRERSGSSATTCAESCGARHEGPRSDLSRRPSPRGSRRARLPSPPPPAAERLAARATGPPDRRRNARTRVAAWFRARGSSRTASDSALRARRGPRAASPVRRHRAGPRR